MTGSTSIFIVLHICVRAGGPRFIESLNKIGSWYCGGWHIWYDMSCYTIIIYSMFINIHKHIW